MKRNRASAVEQICSKTEKRYNGEYFPSSVSTFCALNKSHRPQGCDTAWWSLEIVWIYYVNVLAIYPRNRRKTRAALRARPTNSYRRVSKETAEGEGCFDLHNRRGSFSSFPAFRTCLCSSFSLFFSYTSLLLGSHHFNEIPPYTFFPSLIRFSVGFL